MKDDDAMVQDLVQSTGCDLKLASMLLDFTSGDLKGAKRIIRAVPKDIFAVKVKFITQITGYYGALFFCYDEKDNNISRVLTVVTNDKEIGSIDLGQHWPAFENELYEFMRTKRVDGSKMEQLKGRFSDKEVAGRISTLLKVGQSINDELLNNLLVDELYTCFSDTNIAVKYTIEMTDVFELNKGQGVEISENEDALNPEEVDEKLKEKQEQKKPDQSLIVLKVDPVLSPVKGTEIKNLEFGNNIQVRITDERDIADYLAVLLGGKVESMRVPIYAKIVEVKDLESENVGVLTQFGPGIMGMFKVPADVKVVTKQEEEEEEQEPVKAVNGKKKELNPLWVVGGIVFILGIFVLLIAVAR
ncbi:MAG: hypothetical protein JSV25_06130 [Spirochaetota bacterium]|nr:MAG: hypothetical protein JSV25_06130 [Spirochaetota bacterium]